ncbi:MAG TPA: hypothetical protein VK167_03060 [Flavipsychrobacter sp.]|nr:hypothetical protein [Flavipsychrobacter sp.]
MRTYLLTTLIISVFFVSCNKADTTTPPATSYYAPAYRMQGNYTMEGRRIHFYQIPSVTMLDTVWYNNVSLNIKTINDSTVIATAITPDTTVNDTLRWAKYLSPNKPTMILGLEPSNPSRYGSSLHYDTVANKIEFYGFGLTVNFSNEEQYVTSFTLKK